MIFFRLFTKKICSSLFFDFTFWPLFSDPRGLMRNVVLGLAPQPMHGRYNLVFGPICLHRNDFSQCRVPKRDKIFQKGHAWIQRWPFTFFSRREKLVLD